MSNFDIKKIVLWLFGIMIISFLIAGSIMSVKGVGNGLFKMKTLPSAKQDVNTAKTFSADEIKDMSISTSSTNISLIPVDDTKEIKVHYYGSVRNTAARPAPELEVGLNGGRLIVREKNKVNISIGFNLNSQNLKLDIYVPKSFTGSTDISTSSGDVNIDRLNFDRLNFNSSSGNLNASALNTKYTGLNTSSGAITADLVELKGNISSNSSSGDVKLKLPESSGFSVEFDTSSGDFETNFPAATNQKTRKSVRASVGSGESIIKVRSSSGNLQILKR